MKKLISLVMAAIMLLACCSFASAEADVPEGYPAIIEGLDFGGQTIWLYDWWSNGDEAHSDRSAEPDEDTQKLYEYRDWLEKTYNCKIVEKNWKGWQENPQELATKVADKDASELCLILIDPNFAGGPLANDLYMAWDPEIIKGEQFLSGASDLMTKNGKVYGVLTGSNEPRECVYFNKKVLEDAGINYEEIYDLHKNGEWTWAKLEEYLKKVQRDTDNDGVIDIWGMTGNGDRVLRGCVFGNGGTFFDFNDEGKLVITADSDATLAGIAKRQEWGDTYMPRKEDYAPDGEWNWFEGFWKEGTTAFFVGQHYEGFGDMSGNPLLPSCDFEWGCVSFPKGPNASDYLYGDVVNIWGIPNVYDEETAHKLQQIYALYTIPTPGVDPETSWIGDKYERTDDRAVDEYCAMARENGHQVANKTYLLGSENDVLGPTLYWALGNGTPIEIVEAAREAWQHRCNLFNGDETEEDYQKYLDEKAAAEAAAAEAAAAEAAAEEAPAE